MAGGGPEPQAATIKGCLLEGQLLARQEAEVVVFVSAVVVVQLKKGKRETRRRVRGRVKKKHSKIQVNVAIEVQMCNVGDGWCAV